MTADRQTENAAPGGTGAADCSPALASILEERRRQDAKWGEQNHDPFCYLTVLGEEYGELCQCALHDRFGGPAAEHMREEAVQVAAVALAIVECLDRGKWRWPVEVQENAPLHLQGGATAEPCKCESGCSAWDIINTLRHQSAEIAVEGHSGWGNIMMMAADEIEHLLKTPNAGGDAHGNR